MLGVVLHRVAKAVFKLVEGQRRRRRKNDKKSTIYHNEFPLDARALFIYSRSSNALRLELLSIRACD
ncbi:hypothetical protein FS749_007400 [Ceratobasidium sp. UAMH 11750]|nr:hypothetical protein FS749_007400 [Ceratobasidium sp. UAMH 11750]